MNTFHKSALVLSLVFFAGTAYAQNDHPSVELPPELDRILRDYEKGWQAGDAEALAAIFTVDGFVMSSGRPAVRGREAIIERYANSQGNLHLRALAYKISGNTGYIIGGYTYNPDGDDMGKFILALQRDESGAWLIDADIDNSNSR